jgi:ERF superfamily
MQQSTEIKNLADALGKFQKDVENVKKDATNPFFKSKYASLENIIDTVRPPLAKHGLSFSQFPDGAGLTTILMHSSGEWIQATSSMAAKDQTPQGQGSAITYLRRYTLSSVLGLATEDDDDGNAASKAPEASKTAPRATKPPEKRPNPPVYRSPAVRELDAKTRIVELLDKLADGVVPDFANDAAGKKARADWCASEVQRLTSRSLPLATLEELEAIGDELGKLFDAKN